jgi:hypothetical protein
LFEPANTNYLVFGDGTYAIRFNVALRADPTELRQARLAASRLRFQFDAAKI